MNNKDKEYGIPEQKKFPLDTKAHVISAIKFFNYADPNYRRRLATAIARKIDMYNIKVTPSKSNSFYRYYTPDEIEHHGVLGQKWGVRRYQNPDGTLTDAGRKRLYGNSSKKESFGHRHKRAIEAAVQTDLSKQYFRKAQSTRSASKKNKYTSLSNKAAVNSSLYGKGLSEEEKEFGRMDNSKKKASKRAYKTAWLLGADPITSVWATNISNTTFNREYKDVKKAAKRAYKRYAKLPIGEDYDV